MCSEMEGRVPERYLVLSFINDMFDTNLLYVKVFRVKNSLSMTTLRELQEEYITLEEKQNDEEPSSIARNSQVVGVNLVANVSQEGVAEKLSNNPQRQQSIAATIGNQKMDQSQHQSQPQGSYREQK